MKILILFSFVIISIFSIASPLTDRVLVVRNTNSPSSVAIANDYMLRRGVTNVLDVNLQDGALSAGDEYISYNTIVTAVETPLLAYLNTHPNIDFIVLTKGMPIHFYDFPGQPYGGVCSVDSYIASLNGYANNPNVSYVKVSDPNYNFGTDIFKGHAWINTFWKSTVPFTHATYGGYLVSRLDGYTIADAQRLTTNSLRAESNLANNVSNSGSILLDAYANFGLPNRSFQPWTLLPNNYTFGDTIVIVSESSFGDLNADMDLADSILDARGIASFYENTNAFVGFNDSLNGYVSYGSNDGSYSAATYLGLDFYPGAIGETGVSTGGRTFLPTTGGQSLIVDLIAQGITGIKGYTDEPLLQAIASPSILFERYTKGWTMAESYFAASRMVGWMDILIGDPICIAYPNPNTALQAFDPSKIVVPNPVINTFSTQENCSNWILVDSFGRTIKTSALSLEKIIDVSDIQNGIYYFTATIDGKKSITKMIKISE
jgi:hypothetical protein